MNLICQLIEFFKPFPKVGSWAYNRQIKKYDDVHRDDWVRIPNNQTHKPPEGALFDLKLPLPDVSRVQPGDNVRLKASIILPYEEYVKLVNAVEAASIKTYFDELLNRSAEEEVANGSPLGVPLIENLSEYFASLSDIPTSKLDDFLSFNDPNESDDGDGDLSRFGGCSDRSKL